jgi:hypothetical protein
MKFPAILLFAAALLACARLSADESYGSNNISVNNYTQSLVVSDARKAELKTLAQSAVEDFATRLSKIPQLVALFNDSLTKPTVEEMDNPPHNFGYGLLLDHGVVMVPPLDPVHAQAMLGPSFPDGSCRISIFAGNFGGMMETSGCYLLPVIRNFSIKYFFKINPSDPALEKSVNDAFQQTVLNFALKAGLSTDDIKKFLPGLPTPSPLPPPPSPAQ